MADYINRDKINEAFDSIWDCADMVFEPDDHCCATDDCGHCKWLQTKNAIKKKLDHIPAADVRPVVHRSWIVDDPGDYQLIECDQCHAQMWNHQKELPNYCYCCGADMRKVVEIDQVKEGDT